MCQQLGPGWLGVWGGAEKGVATDQTGEGTGACPKHPLVSPSRDDKQGQTWLQEEVPLKDAQQDAGWEKNACGRRQRTLDQATGKGHPYSRALFSPPRELQQERKTWRSYGGVEFPNLSGSHEGIWSRRRSELRFTWDSNVVLPSQATCQPHTSHPRTTVTWEKHKGTWILILGAEGKKEIGGEDERILKFKKDALTVHKGDDIFQRSDNKVERVWGRWGMLPGKDRGRETGTRGTQGPPGTSPGWGRRVRDCVQVSHLTQRLWRCGHDHLFLAEDRRYRAARNFSWFPARGTSPDEQRPQAWLVRPRRCTSPGLQGPQPPALFPHLSAPLDWDLSGAVFRVLCVQHFLTSTEEEARVNGRQTKGRCGPAVSWGKEPWACQLRKCCSGSTQALEESRALASPVLYIISTLAEESATVPQLSHRRYLFFFPPQEFSKFSFTRDAME